MLSYDWLKILCAIAAAVVGLILFFTMVQVSPARAQQFIVHFYGDYEYGEDVSGLPDVLEKRLSYDVLKTRADSFGSGTMDGASYTARRSSGEGSVVITSDYAAEGETSSFAQLAAMATGGEEERGGEDFGMFYEADKFFAGLEEYLVRFFGENWREGTLNAAEAEKCFRARNVDGPNNKNRYRSDAQIAAGIEDEKARLNALRSDYVYLLDRGLGQEDGLLPYVKYTSKLREYTAGVSLGKLNRLSSLVCYEDGEKKPSHEKIVFLIYNNGAASYDDGTNDGRDDLKYEAVTFLKYLVEQYA